MNEKIGMEPCEAARRIKDDFGIQKALGYLIGEKFISFLRYQKLNLPELSEENLTGFISEIKQIFSQDEIRNYFENVRRVGSSGHIMPDEEYEVFRKAERDGKDPIAGAETVLLVEKAKELLLAEPN